MVANGTDSRENFQTFLFMIPVEWLRFIQTSLDSFFPTPQSGLISNGCPYRLLVAVVLSARCRDDQVNLVVPRLFALASTPESMGRLSVDRIQATIRPCGLSAPKAKAIRELSRLLVTRYRGQVPRSFEDLESLPGVGHKTASVVLGHAFGIPTFPVDTHVHRLARRWRLTRQNSVMATEKSLKNLFPPSLWYRLHLQLIQYGRTLCNRYACRPQNRCAVCRRLQDFFPDSE
ncbi:MAG: endonuclease III [Puniceicoccales bacterium]|jgi:endonuclease-3|nr:endonuclease III [Puniceicoccales bacterium]